MKKKIILSILVLIVLGVIGIWYFVFYSPVHNRRNVADEKAVTLTAPALIKEFLTNENAANAKYVNKAIEISGVVNNVTSDSSSSTVFIATDDSVNTISCRLSKKQDVVKGSTVTVKGILTGYILNEVQLNEAVIISTTVPTTVVNVEPAKATTAAVSKDTIKKLSVDTLKKPTAVAKIYKSIKASIRFFSKTSAEDIEATNTQVVSSLNAATGQFSFAALIKGFRFENEMMQDHFNTEKYMNSDKFPKALFTGTIDNISNIKFTSNATYPVTANGSLTIHGITKKIKVTGTITVEGLSIKLNSVFKIHVQDYGVDGSEVADNVELTVNASYN